MEFKREHLLLYAITDRAWTGRQTLLEQIEDALAGGATMIQLREKNLEKAAFIREAVQAKELCRRYRVPLIINDQVDVALECGADGVHVGNEDTPVAEIRRQAGKDFIIGATAKTVEQAQAAERSGADYLGVGAIFPSPTKTNAIRVTKEQLNEICSSVHIPAIAIGGIRLENMGQIPNCVCGIAVVSAIFAADDIRAATARLKEKAIFIVSK